MARPASSDTRFLEQHRGKWRVTLAVPKALQATLGTRLKRPLNTDSLAVANRVKWQAVAELKEVIAQAGKPVTGKDALTREAVELAAYRARVVSHEELEELDAAIMDRAEKLRGDPIREEVDPDGGGPLHIYDDGRERQAGEYMALAQGRATPLDLHHQLFIVQAQTKARTQADDKRAVKFLKEWCEREGISPTLQAVTRKRAAKFRDELGAIAGGQSNTTLNKYLNRLSRYWQWLLEREHVEADVFAGLKLKAPPAAHGEEERAFTDKEVEALLNGPALPRMHDLMRIGALTGARLDAIVDLKVGDCEGGLFTFKPQKKEKAARAVPIHSALVALIAARTAGKAPDDDLFPEWPAPKKVGSMRERSFKASNQFTDYRRAVGVDDVVPGKRRARVNFHSFRRWFITKAEQADQAGNIIAVVVGHKREGMTLGRYSAGPLMEQARRCVEAVKLPKLPLTSHEPGPGLR